MNDVCNKNTKKKYIYISLWYENLNRRKKLSNPLMHKTKTGYQKFYQWLGGWAVLMVSTTTHGFCFLPNITINNVFSKWMPNNLYGELCDQTNKFIHLIFEILW